MQAMRRKALIRMSWDETSLAPPKSPYRQRLGLIVDEAEQGKDGQAVYQAAYRAGYEAGAGNVRQAWAGEQDEAEEEGNG